MKLKIFILLFFIGFNSIVLAGEYRRIGGNHRALAMGNTGVTSANDSSALYYNPAALANIHTWWWDILGIHIEYSEDAKALYDQVRQEKGLDLENDAARQEFFEDFVGLNPYVRIGLSSTPVVNLHSRGVTLAAGILEEVIVDMETRNTVSPVINIFERWDSVRQYGLSIPIGVGQWVLGLGYKTINRQVLEFDYGLTELLNEEVFPSFPGDALEGAGKGYDLGLMYRFANPLRMSAGIVAQNVGGLQNGKLTDMDLGDAGVEKYEISAGVSIAPQYGIFRLVLAVDVRDLDFHLEESEYRGWARRTHVGAELGIFPISKTYSMIALRGGYNQGYTSYGAEFNVGHAMVVGVTQYSEETGEYAGQKESKRRVYYISFGF